VRELSLYRAFERLNRRRIEYNPLQKRDIIDEIKYLKYQDKALEVIELVDSFWLEAEFKKMRSKKAK